MAATDVLSVDEAQAIIQATNNQGYELDLEVAVTAITALLETRVGPIVIRTVTGEVHPGGVQSIRPYKQPVATITTVTESRWASPTALTAEAFGTVQANGYRLLNGQIERRWGGYPGVFWGDVKITYEAGRYADTASVDNRFKTAAAICLRHNWGQDHGSGNSTFGQFNGADGVPGRGFALPYRALDYLMDDRRVPGFA